MPSPARSDWLLGGIGPPDREARQYLLERVALARGAYMTSAAVYPAMEAGADRARPQLAFGTVDLPTIARHMYGLMMRNVASDGFVFRDPDGAFSLPGCIIAAPSYPANTPRVDQDYVYNWVRDGAITAIEIAANIDDGGLQPLIDYVAFAKACQDNAKPTLDNAAVTLGHACFTVDARPRHWTEQNDGPAIQTLAILTFFDRLDAPTQAIARALMQTNVDYLTGCYQEATTNLWEEQKGLSFFARSVQLACFRAVKDNHAGVGAPAGTDAAITWLEAALAAHWTGSHYVSMLAPPAPGVASAPLLPPEAGYDPNIDIVCAALYGAVAVTDTKLLATAAALRAQWGTPGASSYYPINGADAARGIGPLLGRYPGDTYDGDVAEPVRGGHPWALCTCNVAELTYRVANAVARDGVLPYDDTSAPFFEPIGIAADASSDTAAAALRGVGDAMLRAVVSHSDHLELSEQFDGTSGYEKSVCNLTWSYAAFLSAVRARAGTII